ncbi:MAG: CHAT domain-containing protein, partial [Bacteroidetes bacterium]
LQKLPKDSLLRDWLYDAVVFFKKIEKYPKIEKPLVQLLGIQKELTGEDSPTYLAYRRSLGDYYRHEKRYREAQKIFEANIAYLKQKYPNQPEKYKDELASLAFVYENEQQYEKAERLYLETLAFFEAQKDTTETHANLLFNLVDLLQAQDKNREAIPYCQKLIALQQKRVGKQHNSYIVALRDLQQSYRELQQFSPADSLLQEMLQVGKTLYGGAGYSWSSIYFDLAIFRTEAGKLDEAKTAYLEALSILDADSLSRVEAYKETYTERYAELWAYLGETYARNKEVINAEKAFLKATEYLKMLENQQTFVAAQIYEKISTAQARIDNYAEAEEGYKEAIKICRKIYGDNHHNYIQAVANLATLYSYNAKGQKAVQMLEEMLENLRKAGKEDSPTYLQLLNSKAVAYTALEQDSAVTATYTQILKRYKKLYTEDSPNYMNQFANLIKNQITFKHYEEADKNLKELEKIAERNKIKTIDKFYYGTILVLKGFLANSRGNYAQAVEYGKEENAIGRFLGKPKMGLVGMSMNYFMNNQNPEATASYKKYVDYVIQDVRQVFPYLSENQKVSFYKSEMEYHLDLYYYMALSEPLKIYFGEKDSTKLKANKEYRNKIQYIKHPSAGEIFNLQLITKGILFEASQKMKQAILNSQDAPLIQKFNEWQAKKVEMNKVFLEPDSKQKEEKKAKINTELKDLEKFLAQKSSYFNQKTAKNYTWQDVQKKLKKGEALVEILTINAGQKINATKYKTSDMYLAFIITPDTKDYPLCVRIGEGDSLERKYARNYQNCIKGKKTDNYSYNKYWQRLADTLKSARKIYFAPDGIYHKVNINTLQNPETGKFVIDEKEIQFISQARDFVQQTNLPANLPTEIKLFGAPNYNNLPDSLPTQDVERANNADNSLLNELKKDTTQRFFAGGDIAELPGTATEVHNIANIFGANKQIMEKFLGDDANEGKLKAQRNPAILHIATHGFFVSEKTIQQAKEESATQRSVFASFNERDLENPLRRAGILLAHCKEAFKSKDKVSLPEDGILTAEEAQNLNLDKTDLVVLSACETGLGEVKNGEGVYGLQRAFQTAGAKSVLMSLWTVSDQATQELMTAFYEQWFKLKDKRKAFREAQLALKEKYPEAYYWGAFVLVGE